MRIAVCDDEKRILESICSYIKEYEKTAGKEGTEVFTFSSAAALGSAIEDGAVFDVFLLDVYIGEVLGTALAKEIRRKGIESPIIFLTTSVEHAPEGFEVSALRYLIKPIDREKFFEALSVAEKQSERMQERFVLLKTADSGERVNISHICYTEAHSHYQYITLDGKERVKVRMTVTELFDLLEVFGGFVRVGSAYIVNLRKVKNMTKTEINLYHDLSIPIPRGKSASLRQEFWSFQWAGEEERV